MDLNKYLMDESGFCGNCEKVIVVHSPEDIRNAFQTEEYITFQGGRTGLTGACVPNKGCVLDFSQWHGLTDIKKEDDFYYMTFASGTTLSEIRKEIRKNAPGFCFKPDPTEENATIGGLYSMDAKGPLCFGSGSVSDSIIGLKVITLQGEEKEFTEIEDVKKYAGQEGNLFAITECTIKVERIPSDRYYLILFFEDEKPALLFQERLIETRNKEKHLESLAALDYIDPGALYAFQSFIKEQNSLSGGSDIPKGANCAVYLALQGENELEEELEELLLLLDETDPVEEEWIWAATEENEIDKFSSFRHNVQEALNHAIQTSVRKFSCLYPGHIDVGTENMSTSALIHIIRSVFGQSVHYAICSHYGNREVCVSFLPEDQAEAEWIQSHIQDCAKQLKSKEVFAVRGFGIGKQKRHFAEVIGTDQQQELWKELYDPDGRINPAQ